jgi:hypothetical protein
MITTPARGDSWTLPAVLGLKIWLNEGMVTSVLTTSLRVTSRPGRGMLICILPSAQGNK